MSELPEDAGSDGWPEPTMPQDISVSLRGFASEEGARDFGHAVLGAVRTISGLIDLERLDGITISFDYDEALASVDRGKEGLRPLSRSDGEVIGIAMSPAVLRDGVVKVHLVFSADYIAGILDGEATDAFRFALAVIAHECAHVEVTKQRDLAFPGTVLQAHYDGYEAELFGQIGRHLLGRICRLPDRVAVLFRQERRLYGGARSGPRRRTGSRERSDPRLPVAWQY